MKRRKFLKYLGYGIGATIPFNYFMGRVGQKQSFIEYPLRAVSNTHALFHDITDLEKIKAMTLGNDVMQYKVDYFWGKPDDPEQYPLVDCHEMVMDSNNRLIMLNNCAKNNVIIYDTDGNILESWTLNSRSAHGLTIHKEDNQEFLYICLFDTGEVLKTTLSGEVMLRLKTPHDLGIYTKDQTYKPTETAIAPNGDIYVADGYGSDFILQYDKHGEFIRKFGGFGEGEHHLKNAHGVCIDTRQSEPTLIATSRTQQCFKRFTLDGNYINTIDLPGAFVCRPVIKNDKLYAGVCWSGYLLKPNSGFITILDKDDKVITNLGGTSPVYENNTLQKMTQNVGLFNHCHDVCIDDDENIYLCQWNANGLYPMKLNKLTS